MSLSAILCVCVLAAPLGAWAQDGPLIDAVELQGLDRVSEQLIRAQMEVKAGEPYNPRAIQRDLRRLGTLGFFGKIQVDRDQSGGRQVLTYIFAEKRFIQRVTIIGAKKVKARDLRGALSWKEGDSFLPEAYEEERDAVLDLYRTKGFLNASVEINVEDLSPSRVGITYVVNEGSKARIKNIEFRGNTVLTQRELRKLMQTKKARWFLGGRYDQSVFEQDLEVIVDEFGNYGRLEIKIPRTDLNELGKGRKIGIVVHVNEGPEYRVGSLDIANNDVFDTDELIEGVQVREGDVHNRGQVSADAELMETGYRDSGYVNAQVVPQVTLDRENKTTHVTHNLREGTLKYVREITITGNEVTQDAVIRRNIMLNPGERFDGSLLRTSQRRLERTGFFETTRVSLEEIPGSESEENLLIDVEEGRTGSFNFGAGFSTDESVGGFAEIRLDNFDITNWPTFSGGGQQFTARVNLGTVRQQFNIGFTDPEIGGRPLGFGVDVFNESFRTTGGSNFTEDTQGFQVRLVKNLSPLMTAGFTLRVNNVNIDGLEPIFLIGELRELRDPGMTISTIWSINRSTQNHFRDPTDGANHDLILNISGFGGDNNFVKLEHESTWFVAVDKEGKWVFSFRTREGVAFPFGSTKLLPLQDRFFAGGTSTIRGYDTRDVGPKVRAYGIFGSRDAVGGELRYIANIEAKYKLSDLLRFYTFLDAGGVWFDVGDFDPGDLRYGVGMGIGIDVPRLGPMRLDYGFPINPDGDQGSGRIHLTTGFRF